MWSIVCSVTSRHPVAKGVPVVAGVRPAGCVARDDAQGHAGSLPCVWPTAPSQQTQPLQVGTFTPIVLHNSYFRHCISKPRREYLCFRDDGKDGLKFYTDPGYFFELWRQETEKAINDKVKKVNMTSCLFKGFSTISRSRILPTCVDLHKENLSWQNAF